MYGSAREGERNETQIIQKKFCRTSYIRRIVKWYKRINKA